MVYDHGDYVARDFNGDNTLDVMGLPSAHGSHKILNEVSWHQGIAFLSAGDGSYRFVRTGARINNTATEWQGDYIAKGPIIVGNGPGGGPSQSSHGGGNAVTEPHPGCGAQCGVNRALIFHGLNTVLGPRFNWHNATTADVNKDGKLDLIGFSAGTVIYLGGNGPGGFQPGAYGRHPGNGEYVDLGAWAENTGAFSGTFKDLDGDKYPEMITAAGAYFSAHNGKPVGSVTVWKNNGGKSFTPYQEFMRPTSNGARAMWVNDGDVLIYGECGDRCAENNSISVYATGGGRLHLKQHFSVTSDRGKRGHAPRLVDVNGDGKKDLVVIHYDATVAEQHRGIWLNNGNGTFSQLRTALFNGVPKAGMRGVVIPTKANGDNRLDWIVIYQDGTFGTLLASGGGSVSSATTGSGVAAAAFAGYVEAYGDLSAAYTAGAGQNKANWGKSHYCTYGLSEGRTYTGLSAASCLAAISNGTRNAASAGGGGEDVVHERAMRFLPLENWQLGFVEVEINQLADSLTNNADLLSFNQIQMTDLLGLNPDSAITLGFRADDNESMHHPAYGLRYGHTHLSFMTDSSLLGLHPGGLLHVKSPKTRYLGIRHSKTLGNWTTDGQITYGYAKGKGSYGYVRGVRDIHAMGFNIATRYRLNSDQKVLFSVSQPMRIERGGLVFDGVIGNLVPTGRQTDLTLGFAHQLNQDSTLRTAFTYTTDSKHYQGLHDTHVMLTYSGRF